MTPWESESAFGKWWPQQRSCPTPIDMLPYPLTIDGISIDSCALLVGQLMSLRAGWPVIVFQGRNGCLHSRKPAEEPIGDEASKSWLRPASRTTFRRTPAALLDSYPPRTMIVIILSFSGAEIPAGGRYLPHSFGQPEGEELLFLPLACVFRVGTTLPVTLKGWLDSCMHILACPETDTIRRQTLLRKRTSGGLKGKGVSGERTEASPFWGHRRHPPRLRLAYRNRTRGGVLVAQQARVGLASRGASGCYA